jgi:XRE family transcriptional regulator, regulator of sulfur utilization
LGTRRHKGDIGAGDDHGAAALAGRVAESLKRFRQERQLSLDELSARSGVSRAALSQIEGIRTNPTLTVLWKIAVGLEIPFNDLIGGPREEAIIVLRAGETPSLRSADGQTQSRLLSPGASGDTEVYELVLRPGAVLRSDPHARGTTETLVLLSGALRVEAGGQGYDLDPGDSVFFRADVEHAYTNQGKGEALCIDVIRYLRT